MNTCLFLISPSLFLLPLIPPLTCLHDAFTASCRLSLSPSAFLKVFSMFYLCDNTTSICHTAQCNTHTHTHTTQPILSRLVFQRGSWIWQSWSLALGSGLIKTHWIHPEYYYPPLLSVPVSLAAMWCGWKGLTGAVWGHTFLWKSTRQPCWEGEPDSFCT